MTRPSDDQLTHDMALLPHEVLRVVEEALLRLADREERIADTEAREVPYWAHTPPTVEGHRAAADALRRNAIVIRAAHPERAA